MTPRTIREGGPLRKLRKKKSRLAAVVALAAAIMALAAPGTASAAFLQNWFIDLDGPGGSAPSPVNEFINVIGLTYVQNTLGGGGSGTFTEFGVFQSPSTDLGGSYAAGYELTGVLSATGTVSLGGSIAFTGGTLQVYAGTPANFSTTSGPNIYGANDGTLIGSFIVNPGGGGNVDLSGVPNGQITTLLTSTFLAPGVWLAPDGVTPISSLGLILGFSTTNASRLTGTIPQSIENEIACEGALGLPNGTDCSVPNTLPGDFFLSANGQFRLAIPEPATVVLLGGGLLLIGLVGFARRKA